MLSNMQTTVPLSMRKALLGLLTQLPHKMKLHFYVIIYNSIIPILMLVITTARALVSATCKMQSKFGHANNS